jgi:hypothetical protein
MGIFLMRLMGVRVRDSRDKLKGKLPAPILPLGLLEALEGRSQTSRLLFRP